MNNDDWRWFIFWGATMLIAEIIGFFVELRKGVK